MYSLTVLVHLFESYRGISGCFQEESDNIYTLELQLEKVSLFSL